ncbi:hypothetical protein ACFWFF_27690 [Streptomyces sp. NPDC060223]|uniref:hypothetical protein n=1 Tax=unclassified Streptomyces TaxID=2593676 RepID=UPI003627F968
MNTRIRYATLGLLAVVAPYTRVWAYFSPKEWYENFPGFGLSRLPQLGPYNEHLAKDAGAMFLAMAALTVIAPCSVRNNRLVQTTGAVGLVFNVLHFSSATSGRRRPGTRLRDTSGSPNSSGCSCARRARRYSPSGPGSWPPESWLPSDASIPPA